MEATTTLSETVGVQTACSALNLPRATYYRHQAPEPELRPFAVPPTSASVYFQ